MRFAVFVTDSWASWIHCLVISQVSPVLCPQISACELSHCPMMTPRYHCHFCVWSDGFETGALSWNLPRGGYRRKLLVLWTPRAYSSHWLSLRRCSFLAATTGFTSRIRDFSVNSTSQAACSYMFVSMNLHKVLIGRIGNLATHTLSTSSKARWTVGVSGANSQCARTSTMKKFQEVASPKQWKG